MRNPFSFVACLLSFGLGAQDVLAAAARSAVPTIPRPPAVSEARKHPKLSSDLHALAERMRVGERGETITAEHDLVRDATIQVVVQTTVEDLPAVADLIRETGGHLEAAAGDLVLARVLISQLDALAQSGPAVRTVRRPRSPVPFRTTSEGAGVIGATAWHARGLRGAGVKVAVLDLGFAGYRSLMGSDLPQIPDARVRSFSGDISGGGTEHGTAVAEIVYDVAPDAVFYLVNFSNEVELDNAVDWLIEQDVDVINASWGYPCSGPVDGTGSINEVVKRAADAGILWVAAAGNLGQRHWSGEFRDSNADKWHNFSPSEDGNTVHMAAGDELRVCVEWDDWTNKDQDLDLYVWNSSESIVASSKDSQSGLSSHDPTERLEFTASTAGDYFIGVKRFSGTRNLRLHLYAYEPGAECAVEAIAAAQAAPRGVLEELRRFRDQILAATPAGQQLIGSYYRHSSEVRRILLMHPTLGVDAVLLLRGLRPALRSLLGGDEGVAITQGQATHIEAFVTELAALASPELRDDLTDLRARAAISSATGLTAAQYWRAFLEADKGHVPAENYPSPGYMVHRVVETSLAPPADSAYALTIGAVQVRTGAVEEFSSQGPTADGRRKPDLAAPDGVCTTTYGNCEAEGFSGTSAATAHGAGAVALVKSGYPSLSMAGVRDFLASRAVDVASVGPDNVTGAGRLALETSGPDLFPAPALSRPTGSGVPHSPTYLWSDVSGATSYRLMIATSADTLPNDPATHTCNGCLINTTRPAAYFAPLSCLLPDTRYYWQVQATTETKNGLWAQSSFRTASAPERTPPLRGTLNENAGTAPYASRAVIITHGFAADATSWVLDMATEMCLALGASSLLIAPAIDPPANSLTRICSQNGWDIWVVDWRGDAGWVEGPTIVQGPWDAVARAASIGERLTSRLKTKNYAHVHFIAHSAGSNLIQSATTQLKRTVPGLKIHDTFLDAYDPSMVSQYGSNADWADNYVDTRSLVGWHFGYDDTKWILDDAFNVNVTPAANEACGVTCRHSRPYRFYGTSVSGRFPDLATDPISGRGGTGFDLSVEKGKSLSWLQANYPKYRTCTIDGDACTYAVTAPRTATYKTVGGARSVTASDGPVTFTEGSTSLFDSIRFGLASLTSTPHSDGFHESSTEPTDPPAWIVVDVTTTEPVSTLRFHRSFRSSGEGLLRIFVDGRLVREIDQRHLIQQPSQEDIYVGGPAGALAPGTHTVVFRLDGFAAAASAVELTKVELGHIVLATRRRAIRH